MAASKIALLAVLMGVGAQAQSGAYGQCGGLSWTGATTCVAGYTCVYSNPYYSQCLAGGASSASTLTKSTTSAKTTAATTSKTTTAVSPTGTVTGTKYLFTFGDSYSQTGFDPTSTYASAKNPIGNPAYPGYTTDNGANWIGHLVEGLNTSLTLSYNFAYGGATVNASLVAPYESTVLSLIDQVSEFTKYVASKPASTPWTSSDALFGVWLGVNDIGNSYYTGSTESATLTAILKSYFGQMQILYNAGARYFVFLTVPPIQKTPLMLAEAASSQTLEAQTIATFNSQLASSAASFASANSGTKYWVYDTQVPFNTAINNPTAYGAADATCYNSDGVTCLWWNNYHPGQAIQTLVAKGVAAALKGTFF